MKFKKGQSGNPAGRKPGTTAGSKIRQAIEESREDIIKAVIEAAKNGDMTACKMLLDRICPPLKAQVEPVSFTIAANDSLAGIGQVIIDSISRGEIAPDTGSQLITALSAQARIIETAELIERIEKLEAKINESKK
jgi:hypothetical protein